MRLPVFLLLVVLAACNNRESKTTGTGDTTTARRDTTVQQTGIDSANYTAPGAALINQAIASFEGGRWHVITDRETGWLKDAMDYFVWPKRQSNPDYPYISRGDYNCDGQTDMAAMVTDTIAKEHRLLFLLAGNEKPVFWKDDMQGAAISNLMKGEVSGFLDEKEKKIQLNCDAVNAEWFEKASRVIYWNGKSFDQVWTGD